jgi:hypothetical protein
MARPSSDHLQDAARLRERWLAHMARADARRAYRALRQRRGANGAELLLRVRVDGERVEDIAQAEGVTRQAVHLAVRKADVAFERWAAGVRGEVSA